METTHLHFPTDVAGHRKVIVQYLQTSFEGFEMPVTDQLAHIAWIRQLLGVITLELLPYALPHINHYAAVIILHID